MHRRHCSHPMYLSVAMFPFHISTDIASKCLRRSLKSQQASRGSCCNGYDYILIGLQCPVLAELTAGEAGAGCCTGADTSHVFDARHDLPSRHGRNLDLSHRSELAPSFPAFHSRRAAWRRTLPLALLGLALAYLRLNFNVALPGIGL